MSPTFFHHEFPSNRRTQVTFTDNSPNIYIAGYWAEQWVDTALLPPESTLCDSILSAHCAHLFENLDKAGVSVDDAFDVPNLQQAIFTYRAAWRFDASQRSAHIEIVYGQVVIHQLPLPEIRSIEKVSLAQAQTEMLLWRVGLSRSG